MKMTLGRWELHRRTFLRGLGGAGALQVALPALDAMLNTHGTALADGKPLPKRFGVWFWGNGPSGPDSAFFPTATGPEWVATEALASLARTVKPYVTVVSGTEIKFDKGTAHHVSRTGPLSGSYNLGSLNARTDSLLPSIDRLVADAWVGRSRLDSIEIGISRAGGYTNSTSFKPGQRYPSEWRPEVVFAQLFKGGAGNAAAAPTVPAPGGANGQVIAQVNVLDTVMEDARALSRRLGAVDKIRLESHLDTIGAIQKRLVAASMAGPLQCTPPALPSPAADTLVREDLVGRHALMTDLLSLALACDITRVFSIEFSGAQAKTIFWQVGAEREHHGITHVNQPATERKIAGFVIDQFAVFLERMMATREGAGNLLDSSAIYHTTEYMSPASHRHIGREHPIIIAGKAAGALRSGIHLRAAPLDNMSKVLMALLLACDVPATEAGAGAGRVTDPLPGLLT